MKTWNRRAAPAADAVREALSQMRGPEYRLGCAHRSSLGDKCLCRKCIEKRADDALSAFASALYSSQNAAPQPNGNSRHDYVPSKEHYGCAICGYADYVEIHHRRASPQPEGGEA